MGEILVIICVLLVMFLPTFIARARNHKHKNVCIWVNLIIGWTVIGWIPLLVWSLMSSAE